VIGRLVAVYVGIFTIVLIGASIGLYLFLAGQYHSILLPALTTPEGTLVYAQTMRKVALEIVAADVPLLILVGLASWVLARLSLQPLLSSEARERAFIADAAHELRSPLTTIASVAQAARDERDEGRLSEAFETIVKTAMDASEVVSDLLTLARAPGPGLLQREPVDLAAIARSCAREFDERARAGGLLLDVHPEPAIVNGDARRLRELLRNLLENAVKHAAARIIVSTGVEEGRAFVRVSDDGAGVAPDLRSRLFERFVTGVQGGSGLGLAIAQWVARAHEGTLALDERESGASFVALFPMLT
jgi:two-component system, OmpR family, sensor kinase